MGKILYITEPRFDYNRINANSKLLDSVESDIVHSEYHTSLGDLTSDQILSISREFECIVLVPQGFDTESDIFKESQILVEYLTGPTQMPDTFANQSMLERMSESPVLWVFGCSHSAGVGLLPFEKKYSELLAAQLGLPLNLVALPGSSVNWSFRQLINAKIKPNDIIVWQLTSPNRTSVCNNSQVTEVMLAATANRFLLEVLTDDQLYFNQMTLLNAGTQYLRSLGNRFVLVSLESNQYTYRYRSQYVRYPEYCYVPTPMLDLGTDKLHMGPLSHQALAKHLEDRLYYLDEQSI
jgi:hypothetical protein